MPGNTICLKQSREMIQRLIDENPSIISIWEKATMLNGKGDVVINPNAPSIEVKIKCRISHEVAGTFTIGNVQGALTSNLGRYILTNYKTKIISNTSFDAIDDKWRIGKVDPLWKFKGVIGYQAPLIQAVAKVAST